MRKWNFTYHGDYAVAHLGETEFDYELHDENGYLEVFNGDIVCNTCLGRRSYSRSCKHVKAFEKEVLRVTLAKWSLPQLLSIPEENQ